MEWLIGMGRKSSSRNHRPVPNEDFYKAYMNDISNRGQLIDNISKEDIRQTVPAPVGVDLNEWLATNTLSFFNHISLLYDSLQQYCTSHSCTAVTTGGMMSYTWVDERGKKTRLSAPQYIELVIVNIQKHVTDENIFPTKYDMTFPTNFLSVVKKIFRFLFHILVHLFQSHYEHFTELQLIKMLNTVFIHFIYFQSQHALLDNKEMQPLEDLIQSLSL